MKWNKSASSERKEKKSRNDSSGGIKWPFIPHERFEFEWLILDNRDKVAARAAALGLSSGIRFIKDKFPCRANVIATGSVVGGHMNILRRNLPIPEMITEILRISAIHGHLHATIACLTKQNVEIKSVKSDAVAAAFNHENTLKSRIRILQLFASHPGGDALDFDYSNRVGKCDLPIDVLNDMARQVNRNKRGSLFETIYIMALQTNNRELAIHARLRSGDEINESRLFPGCSVELWKEMRGIDQVLNQERKAHFDAKEMFASACEAGNATFDDWKNLQSTIRESKSPDNADEEHQFIYHCIRRSIEFGGATTAIRFLKTSGMSINELGIHAESVVDSNNLQLLDAFLDANPKDGEIDDLTRHATSTGNFKFLEAIRGRGHSVSANLILNPDDRFWNAISDDRDRVRCIKLVHKLHGSGRIIYDTIRLAWWGFPEDFLVELQTIIGLEAMKTAAVDAVDKIAELLAHLDSTGNIPDNRQRLAEYLAEFIKWGCSFLGMTRDEICRMSE